MYVVLKSDRTAGQWRVGHYATVHYSDGSQNEFIPLAYGEFFACASLCSSLNGSVDDYWNKCVINGTLKLE